MNSLVLNVNPKNECNYHEMFVSQQNVATCHARHIFMPIDQTIKKLIYLMKQFVNVAIQSHPIKDGCYKSNEKCLILATINPISCSHPVYHGTFLMFSLINF